MIERMFASIIPRDEADGGKLGLNAVDAVTKASKRPVSTDQRKGVSSHPCWPKVGNAALRSYSSRSEGSEILADLLPIQKQYEDVKSTKGCYATFYLRSEL